MTYKKYINWCDDRAMDGRWPLTIALICCGEANKVYQLSFWKRHKKMKTEIPQEYTDMVNFVNKHYNIEVD